MSDKFKISCEVCERACKNHCSLAVHVLKKHNLPIKKYYDTFLKKEDGGICLECKSPTSFKNLSGGYRTYCSNRCSQLNQKKNVEMLDKKIRTIEETKLNKYGSRHYSNLEKTKSTCVERFGVDNFLKRTDLIKERWQNKFGTNHPSKNSLVMDKRKKKLISLYGVENQFQRKEVREKTKKTIQEKYGRDCNCGVDAFIKVNGKQAWKAIAIENFKKALGKKQTSLETKLYDLLSLENIRYVPQYELEGKFYDAYLSDYQTLLEFDGDFWHPKDLKDCLYPWQQKNYYNDREKDNIAKKNFLNIVRIRESDEVSSIKNLIT